MFTFFFSAGHKDKKKHKHKHKHSHHETEHEEKKHKHKKHNKKHSKKHKKPDEESVPPPEAAPPKRTKLEDKPLADLERARELLAACLFESQHESKEITLVSGDYGSDDHEGEKVKNNKHNNTINIDSEQSDDNNDVIFVKSSQKVKNDHSKSSRRRQDTDEKRHKSTSMLSPTARNKENKQPSSKLPSHR